MLNDVETGNDYRRTILIVEDDDLFRKSLTTFVSSLGYTTLSARSAEEALDECTKGSIGACVSDFHLPAMNGIELAEALRTRGLEIPVVLLSGYLTDAVRAEAKVAGVLTLLRKPTDLGQLQQTIARLFTGKGYY
ncbi:MAG: response regulator [Bacteroidota bacterium]